MESLGFIEEDLTRVSSWQTPPTVSPGSESTPSQVAKVDPFDDWSPTEVGRGLLTGRVRWTVLVGVVMMCAGIAGVAAWIYQRPAELARDALVELETTAGALQPAVLALHAANDHLLSPLDRTSSHTQSLLEVDKRARALYEASASLTAAQSSDRVLAADAASAALEASATLRDGLGYRAGIVPILAMPELQTDPQLIELDEAALAFGEWQAQFDAVLTALPEQILAPLTAELASISGTLESSRMLYLDALRNDDPDAAQAVLDTLQGRLSAAETLLEEELVGVHARVALRIEASLAAIDSLVG